MAHSCTTWYPDLQLVRVYQSKRSLRIPSRLTSEWDIPKIHKDSGISRIFQPKPNQHRLQKRLPSLEVCKELADCSWTIQGLGRRYRQKRYYWHGKVETQMVVSTDKGCIPPIGMKQVGDSNCMNNIGRRCEFLLEHNSALAMEISMLTCQLRGGIRSMPEVTGCFV